MSKPRQHTHTYLDKMNVADMETLSLGSDNGIESPKRNESVSYFSSTPRKPKQVTGSPVRLREHLFKSASKKSVEKRDDDQQEEGTIETVSKKNRCVLVYGVSVSQQGISHIGFYAFHKHSSSIQTRRHAVCCRICST